MAAARKKGKITPREIDVWEIFYLVFWRITLYDRRGETSVSLSLSLCMEICQKIFQFSALMVAFLRRSASFLLIKCRLLLPTASALFFFVLKTKRMARKVTLSRFIQPRILFLVSRLVAECLEYLERISTLD